MRLVCYYDDVDYDGVMKFIVTSLFIVFGDAGDEDMIVCDADILSGQQRQRLHPFGPGN